MFGSSKADPKSKPPETITRRSALAGIGGALGASLWSEARKFASSSEPASQLRDAIERLSGPETGPAADNLVSNEDSYPRIAGQIAEDAPRNGVYLGVGPDQNFTMIAHSRPRWALIVDYRRRNLLLHLAHYALFRLSPDRVSYLERLTARKPTAKLSEASAGRELVEAFSKTTMDRRRLDSSIADARKVLGPLGIVRESEWAALATIQAKMAGPGLNARFLALPMYPTLGQMIQTPDAEGRSAHFLSQEPLYQVVRDLQREERVVPAVGDFGDPAAFERLRRWLREGELKIALAYVSDVEFFLLRVGKFDAYARGLESLPRLSGAMLARTSTREVRHPQRVRPDSSTTIAIPIAQFLDAWRAGRIRDHDALFRD